MILFSRRKMKDDISRKKIREHNDGLSRKLALQYDLSSIQET